MKLQAENPDKELRERGYELKESFSHDDLMEVIVRFTDRKNRYTRAHNWLMMALLALIGGYIGLSAAKGDFTWGIFINLGIGAGIALLLIPIHELIHGLFFRLQGATRVHYSVIWKKLVFYAIADKFIAGYRPFRVVALAPFVIITSAAVLVGLSGSAALAQTMAGLIAFHTACCIGDFALLGYMHELKEQEAVTYDDEERKMSFIWVKG